MITLKEQEILEEIQKGSNRAKRDIQALLSKVYDDDLALDLNCQATGYSKMQERAEEALLEAGIVPENISIMERAKQRASLWASTALNISTHHIAALVRDMEKECLRNVERAMEGTAVHTSGAYALGEEFCKFDEQNMQVLNAYRF